MMTFRRRAWLGILTWVVAVTFISRAATPPRVFRDATIIPVATDVSAPSSFVGYLIVGGDGRISAIGPGEPTSPPAGAEVVSLTGRIVLPGFISAHSHLWQSAWRGVAPDKQLYGWLQALHWTIGAHFAPGDLLAFTRHGAADYLRHGVTTVFNHSQNLGFPEALNLEQLDGALAVPQRIIHAYAFSGKTPVPELERNIDAYLARARELAARDPRVLGPAFSTDGIAFTPALRGWWATFSKDHDWLTQFHFLESPEEISRDTADLQAYEDAGLFTPHTVVAHFVQSTPEIVALLVRHGSAMSWNPLSNGRLASGLADIPAYRAAGLRIGMGLDGQASADVGDPLENMRLGLYATRMVHKSAVIMGALDVIRLHTLESARVLGVADRVGSLEPGKFADFVVLDPANPATGRVVDAPSHVVFTLSYGNLESVYLAGERVVSHGDIAGVDDAAVETEADARAAALAARAGKK